MVHKYAIYNVRNLPINLRIYISRVDVYAGIKVSGWTLETISQDIFKKQNSVSVNQRK